MEDRTTRLSDSHAAWEQNLPPFIQTSIANMVKSWAIEDSGERDPHWDLWWCELNADINSLEVERNITPEQAWYLRETYLRMEKPETLV